MKMKKILLFALMALAISCGKNDDPLGQKKPENVLIDISFSPSKLTFDAIGGERSVQIYLSYYYGLEAPKGQWKLTGGESWCTPSAIVGYDSEYITFTVGNYAEEKERTATFICSCNNIEAKFIITQTGCTSINVKDAGTLDEALSKFDKSAITALKITGNLNDEDFLTIRELPNLEHLDIFELPLTALPTNAFTELKLQSVILPNSLITISKHLFYHCELLKSIAIPTNVETIETGAFYGCRRLATVKFNSKLKIFKSDNGGGYASTGAFAYCEALKTIEIPASVEAIEEHTFKGCSALATITFKKPSKLKTIGEDYENNSNNYGAFGACAITSIEIPASVETIGPNTFGACKSLTTVTFDKDSQLQRIGGVNSDAVNISYLYGAFYNCSNLKTVDATTCKSIAYVDGYSFYGCSLALFKIGTATPPICRKSSPFEQGLDSYSILKVPSGCADTYKKASGWNDFASITGLDE